MINKKAIAAWTKPVLTPIGTIADVAGAQGAPPIQNVAKS